MNKYITVKTPVVVLVVRHSIHCLYASKPFP